MGDFEQLRQEIYAQYGIENLLAGQKAGFDFPEPLDLEENELEAQSGIRYTKLRHHLLHDYARQLLPFVEETLGRIHINNPVFRGDVDRESLAQIVDRIFRQAGNHGLEIGGAPLVVHQPHHASDFIRALINALVVMELLIK